MKGFCFSLSSLKAAYARGVRAEDVAAEALKRADAYSDPAVWITRASADAVLARARALDAMPVAERAKLPLFGVPFAVKDNIDCAGLPTSAACPAFAYQPKENAPVVARLLDAGAILIGKTNLDQFATGLVGTRSPYGAPRSVFNADYISGGSSSGSAVAVAAGLVSFSLGTDTAGSGRVPAAFNNIAGLKPSRGLLSARGVVPACRSLDCVSIFALTAEETAEIFRQAAVFDAEDPYARARLPDAPVVPGGAFTFAVPKPGDLSFFGDGESERLSMRRSSGLNRSAAARGASILLPSARRRRFSTKDRGSRSGRRLSAPSSRRMRPNAIRRSRRSFSVGVRAMRSRFSRRCTSCRLCSARC